MGSGSSRGGATHLGEAHRLWGDTPALSGLVGQPKRLYAPRRRKSREKKKEEVGRKGDSLPPNQVQLGLGGDLPPLARLTPLGLLEPQGKAPSLPPIYTEVLELI